MEIIRRKFWEDYWGPYLSRWEKVFNFLNPARIFHIFPSLFNGVFPTYMMIFEAKQKCWKKKKTTHTPTRRVKILSSISS